MNDAPFPSLSPGVRRRGFTLVELMVAMVLLGVLTALIYGLFSTTGDALSEVDSLAETTDIARFALEHVRNDLQAVGAQLSPNSQHDPWVRPERQAVIGLLPYQNWQDRNHAASRFSDSGLDNGLATALDDANPHALFDGIILVGAYDFPQSVMFSQVSNNQLHVDNRPRGLFRMMVSDPFFRDPTVPADFYQLVNAGTNSRTNLLTRSMQYRGIRIMDHQGFIQFAPIATAAVAGQRLTVTLAGGHQLAEKSGSMPWGIDPLPMPDVEYDGAFVDAYWYYVVQDETDPYNWQLVRERLDFSQVIGAAVTDRSARQNLRPAASALPPLADRERVVIANRVVDFQIWFDCHDGMNPLNGLTWNTGWTPPTSDCVVDDPERARVAHIRLSIRTANERANRPHITIDPIWPGFEVPNGPMLSYDINPTAVGSAAVVTLQTSVELTNFAMRNL